MKQIKVVAAIIKNEDKILATKRGYGEFINMWEFPGGKIESGETKKQALVREIKEELNTLNWLPADIDAVNYLKENM